MISIWNQLLGATNNDKAGDITASNPSPTPVRAGRQSYQMAPKYLRLGLPAPTHGSTQSISSPQGITCTEGFQSICGLAARKALQAPNCCKVALQAPNKGCLQVLTVISNEGKCPCSVLELQSEAKNEARSRGVGDNDIGFAETRPPFQHHRENPVFLGTAFGPSLACIVATNPGDLIRL